MKYADLNTTTAMKVRLFRRSMRAGMTLDEIVTLSETTIKEQDWRESEKAMALVVVYDARDYIKAHPTKGRT